MKPGRQYDKVFTAADRSGVLVWYCRDLRDANQGIRWLSSHDKNAKDSRRKRLRLMRTAGAMTAGGSYKWDCVDGKTYGVVAVFFLRRDFGVRSVAHEVTHVAKLLWPAKVSQFARRNPGRAGEWLAYRIGDLSHAIYDEGCKHYGRPR